jgi:CheY-like chemotaxis protein
MTSSAQRRKILVVDDNRDAADTLAMLLDFLGYDTRTAYDGQQGVDAATAFQPDLVILDINMPVVDGYQAARMLRNARGTSRAVLVALTARGSATDRAAALQAGFDYHVVKPVDGAGLAELVGHAVEDAEH